MKKTERTTEIAPDGSIVQPLCRTVGGSMARFSFAGRSISQAVRHKEVAELWYVLSGEAEIWREEMSATADISGLRPGAGIAIPPGCAFQVRVSGSEPLEVVAVTMPPWPGDDAAERVAGNWTSSSG